MRDLLKRSTLLRKTLGLALGFVALVVGGGVGQALWYTLACLVSDACQ